MVCKSFWASKLSHRCPGPVTPMCRCCPVSVPSPSRGRWQICHDTAGPWRNDQCGPPPISHAISTKWCGERGVTLRKADKADGWDQVRKTVIANGTRRSPLWRWMHRNHDRLSVLFEEAPPSWEVLVETFGGMGLTDREGKNPTAETARKTWYRVRRNIAAARARRAKPASDGSVPAVAFRSRTSARSAAPSVPVREPAGEAHPRPRKFGLAQLRGHPSSAPPPSPLIPEPERIQRSPEEVARIVADLMSGAPKNPFRRDKGD
jgi:hypothetical protein